ncbi:MAG: hypothetical protein IKV89_00720 [Clostridia bacterium]|nr:hypothetical protein [Clostridia bacterium]
MKRQLQISYKIIKKYKNAHASNTKPTSSDEWLLDNFYIINQETVSLYEQIDRVPKREIRGFKRDTYIVLLAGKFLKKNELRLTLPELVKFLKKEQEKNPLKIAELWFFPSAVRIALISEIAALCKKGGAPAKMANAIKSLIAVRDINWKEEFERLCPVDGILNKDKHYQLMNFETKQLYRKAVTRIAHITGTSETAVACAAIECAGGKQGREGHVGYYLIDKGEQTIRKKMGVKAVVKTPNPIIYIGANIILTHLLCTGFYIVTRSIAGTLLAILPAFDIVRNVLDNLLLKTIPPRRLPSMELKDGIPYEGKTLIVYPTLLTSAKQGIEMAERAEVCYLANREDNLRFAVLGDFKDSDNETEETDKEIIDKTRAKIRELNKKYGDKFLFLHRQRTYSKNQSKWMGRERKRGALADLNSFLRGKYKFKYVEGNTDDIKDTVYVITLDSDTFLPIGGAKKLVGTMMHPLNKAEIKGGRVTDGYGIIEPKIQTDLTACGKTFFSRVYAGQGGVDNYSALSADVYMDLFGEAVFTGKGIYNVDVFEKCTGNTIPDNKVLSHDLLEGSYCRCGLSPDVEVYDGYPSNFMSYTSRQHRWIRGDWQILQWLFRRVEDKQGVKVKNPLSALSKWKIFDNLRRSLTITAQVILILSAPILQGGTAFWTGLAVISLAVPVILYFIYALLSKSFRFLGEKTYADFFYGARASVYQATLKIIFSAYTAYISTDAAVRAVFRLKKKRKTLEWVTAAEKDKKPGDGVGHHYIKMFWSVVMGFASAIIFIVFDKMTAGTGVILGVMWAAAPLIACFTGLEWEEERDKFARKHKESLFDMAERIWRFFDRYMNEGDNFLPPDNVQIQPYKGVAHRTSPTNIGLGMVAVICAYKLGFITLGEVETRLNAMVNTIDKMEKWRGHLYNWYNTATLEPLRPRYVSTVDSGNFACYLMVVAKAVEKDLPELAEKILGFSNKMVFAPLYDEDKKLFSIGYSVDENRLTNSYYDLLASEARQAGLLAVAKGEVKPEHWFRLDRSLTASDGYKGLVSWTGTMFEYLMPLLIMKNYKNSLFSETYRFVLQNQKKYGQKRRIPWGVSESGYYSFDKDGNYQYKAFGIPELGLKRGLSDDVVITPYATFLGIMVDPEAAMSNIERLKKEGMYGEYGMFEAMDYRPDPAYGVKKGIVKSYMAHHQGMSLAAITNILCEGVLQELFHAYPEVKAAEPLLKEKVPVKVSVKKDTRRTIEPVKSKWQTTKECVRGFSEEYALPPMHILSNGAYSVVVDSSGNGYSILDRIMLNKFDLLGRGQNIYIKCTQSGKGWSGYGTNCVFAPHVAEFRAENDKIETNLSVYVTPDDNAEIRRVTIINKSDSEKNFEVFMFYPLSLTTHNAQVAHSAFADLFVRTEYKEGVLYGERRKREADDKTFTGFCMPVVESKSGFSVQFETDRSIFVGRGGNHIIPGGFTDINSLSGGVGNVLDPCFAFRVSVSIDKGESASVSFVSGLADSINSAKRTAEKYKGISPMEVAEDAYASVKAQNLSLNLREGEEKAFLNALPHIVYGGCPTGEREKCILQNRLPQTALWKMGISGDVPIVLVQLLDKQDISVFEEMLRAHAYWRYKGIQTDLVVLCDEPAGYTKPLSEEVRKRVVHGRNGVYLINSDISEDDRTLLCAISKLYINAARGGLEQITPSPKKPVLPERIQPKECKDVPFEEPKEFYNGYGGFDGEEYVINQKEAGSTPAPWVNVVANPVIGFIAGESGGGYTWRYNSRQYRISAWQNDPVCDKVTEKLVIKEGDDTFSPMAGTFDEKGYYSTRHGFGYTRYLRKTRELDIEVLMFVPVSESVKFVSVKIKNNSQKERKFRVSFSVQPVIGVNMFETRGKKRYFPLKDGAIGIQNAFSGDDRTVFMASAGQTHHHLKDIMSGISRGDTGGGYDADVSVYENAQMSAGEEKQIVFMLGAENSRDSAENLIQKYRDIRMIEDAFEKMCRHQKSLLGAIRVKTPSKSLDIMLNGRLLYQAFVCRMLARTGFYQSSGAYGFRDQLQDSLALMYAAPERAREQILRHAAHQFEEGDVLHWWHEEENQPDKGVRTRFSDDRLWLCYLVLDYIRITGDKSILDEKTEYIVDRPLEDGEDERYTEAVKSTLSESILEHCKRAIEISINKGEHGLPLMGGGDWNDGMNNIGIKGKGESVWLVWFFAGILMDFAEYTDEKTAKRYREYARDIVNAADKAWDGEWYKRAYFDDGTPLGSAQSEECRIDAISQSWSVISGMGDKEKTKTAMKSVKRLLVDDTHGIVKLLTPPFDKSKPSPGYIQSYLPGIRENGGQYTHAAVWTGIAYALLGDGEQAMKIFEMINPINHSDVQLIANIYKTEPYAVAADVYSTPPHTGRGGWTWYTGAAAWMYRFGVEYLLGFKKKGNKVKFEPALPEDWKEYTFEYMYKETPYIFNVKRGNKKTGEIQLVNDKKEHTEEVYFN